MDDIDTIPPAGDAFEWAWAASRDRNWPVAAQRWAALRRLYADHAPPWIQGAIAACELQQYEHARWLLTHARNLFPDNANAWIQSIELAWRAGDAADTCLAHARYRFP